MENNTEIKRGRRHLFAPECSKWIEGLRRNRRMSACTDSSAPVTAANPAASSAAITLPCIEDRSFWEGLAPDLKEKIKEQGSKALDAAFPPLLISDYREFCQNGNRSRFESKYFAKRTMLTSLVLAECVEDQGRFLDKILDGLYLILEETTWCLPAHNAYIRDTPQLPLPDAERPVIDLFAAETGAILSVSEALLDSRLKNISPLIEQYVTAQIRKRILEPYLSYHFWWMGDGKSPMLNWTPWITQNVLLSVFGRKPGFLTPDQQSAILSQACLSLDYFLDEYGDDGCCNEGAQYFEHAGLCLFGCMEILRQITGDDLHDLFFHPLIRNIADYIVRMYAGGGYYFNYADCSARPGHRNARDFLFAIRTQNQALAEFSAADYRSCSWDEKLLTAEENIWYHLLQIQLHSQMTDYPDTGQKPEDSWFESTGILIARDGRFSLAARAGSNGDSHNHNDVGSVILYKDSRPFLIDLGVETYTSKTFSPQRYEIWTMQSAYHNLPTFYDGDTPVMQKAGPEYAAASVSHEISEQKSCVSMDLAPVYADPRIRSFRRTVTLYKGESVTIEDQYDGELSCVLSLMTFTEPVIKKAGESLFQILLPSVGLIEAAGIKTARYETCPIRDPRLKKAWEHDCFRILLGGDRGRFSVSFF